MCINPLFQLSSLTPIQQSTQLSSLIESQRLNKPAVKCGGGTWCTGRMWMAKNIDREQRAELIKPRLSGHGKLCNNGPQRYFVIIIILFILFYLFFCMLCIRGQCVQYVKIIYSINFRKSFPIRSTCSGNNELNLLDKIRGYYKFSSAFLNKKCIQKNNLLCSH